MRGSVVLWKLTEEGLNYISENSCWQYQCFDTNDFPIPTQENIITNKVQNCGYRALSLSPSKTF